VNCLGCAACVAACPVAASDGRFAGPKVLGPALERHRDGGWPGEPALTPAQVEALGARLCLGCHRCDLACPSGIEVSAAVRRAKTLAASQPTGAWQSFTERLLRDQERLGRLVALAGGTRRLLRRVGPRLSRRIEGQAAGTLGLSPYRALPLASGPSLARWLARTRDPVAERGRPPVLLFAGCHGRFHDPGVARDAARVLRAAGYRVLLPSQLCCGSPALSQGDEELAARAAEANLRFLGLASARFGGSVPVVSPCPSCTLALRDTLPAFTGGPEAARLAEHAWDLGEFLAGPAREALMAALDGALAARAGEPSSPVGAEAAARSDAPHLPWLYHTPCHLRALGVGRPFPALLSALASATARDAGPASDGCCGVGGLNGLTRDGHAASLAAGGPVLEAYRTLARENPSVLSDCPVCRWQIADATGLPTAHPVQRLAALLGD